MARVTLTALLGVVSLLAGSIGNGFTQPPSQVGPETATLVKGNNAFALDLYEKLSTAKGNVFFSPYSISTALAMTYGGARAETADEMARVLHFTADPSQLHRTFSELIGNINGKPGTRPYELTTANRLWGQNGYAFDPAFLKQTDDNYGAGLKEVDFARNTEQARQAINGWVEDQTNQKIKELLKPGILTPNSRFVLTNAIYFKSSWNDPFPKQATKPGHFKLTDDKSIAEVPLMQKIMPVRYLAGEGLQVAALPYAKNELSMVVLLPNKVDGLAELEKSLFVPGFLDDLLGKMKQERVKVILPKFKVTSEFQLSEQLKALGMPTAFSSKANFTGISTREPLWISAVIHKAFVDVHEAGTEAAAATAVVGMGGAAPGKAAPPPEFRADHPFIYLIRDNNSGSILFMGRLQNPKA